MKKKFKILSLALVAAATLGILSGCASKDNPPAQENLPVQEEVVMSQDELIAAAKAEGKVVVYSITSRISKAAEAFEQKYGIKVEASNLKDFELVEKVSKEVGGGIVGADFVIAQDSGRVYGELINTGYLVNYVPESMKDIIPQEFQNPLSTQFINKVFIFNNEKSQEPIITNVWQLTEPAFAGLVQFKNPFQEGVNSNFLTMVTSPEWSGKLAAAYKDLYGREIELTTENAGYEWIKMFFENGAVLGTSDTTISENIGIKGQPQTHVGLFVFSKTRFDESKDLALQAMTDVKPFAGFYYPAYAMLTSNAKNPNAAKLFIEYLLTEEGFAPWGKDVGAYSSNPNIGINEGDYPMDFWRDILVPEDPEFIYENRTDVEEFISQYIYE